MQQGTAEEAGLVRRAVASGGLADLDGVLAAIRRSGSARLHPPAGRSGSAGGAGALDPIPATQYRDSLIQFGIVRGYADALTEGHVQRALLVCAIRV